MKKTKYILASVVFIISMIIAPSILNAAPVEFSGNGHYYELIEERLSWSDARDSAVSMGGYLATITSQEEDDFIDNVFNGYFWIGGYQLEGSTEPDGGWQWVTGEDWSYTNWFSGEPSNSVGAEDSIEIGRFSGSYWNDAQGSLHSRYYLVEYDTNPNIVEEEPARVRTMPMTCWQVFINEDNNFEFVFWWEYANNNWVKIYDMSGNEVFSIDMTYGKANFETDIPDGMYTVKTFHDGFDIPIQEFVIGKP